MWRNSETAQSLLALQYAKALCCARFFKPFFFTLTPFTSLHQFLIYAHFRFQLPLANICEI